MMRPSFQRPLQVLARIALAIASAALGPSLAVAQVKDDAIVDAREALRKKDKAKLSGLRQTVVAASHPLAGWVDYWDLSSRLNEVQQAELDAFYARWPGTYVEDRLRNDWLLELGRRRDWANFNRELPRYRMNDDREVGCYALLNQHYAGQDVKAAARAAWYAQRDLDDGCNLLASTLYDAKLLSAADAWREARLSIEFNRPRAARAAAALVDPAAGNAVGDLFDNPARFLKRRVEKDKAALQKELLLLALVRLASSDPDAAASELDSGLLRLLNPEQQAWAWAAASKQAALKLLPQAADFAHKAWRAQRSLSTPPLWSDDTLAWQVRAALRSTQIDRDRWRLVADAIDAMTAGEQRDTAWLYWRARALTALAKPGAEGEADRQAAQQSLQALATTLGFYGKLASEELGMAFKLPPTPAPLTETELAAAALPGFKRALALANLGLRDEGRREWNFTLRGMNDRELMASAQLACNLADWQICINTSERTKQEIDVRQRYPQPFKNEILASAQQRGLDPAFVFGLIRQETRFMPTLRSSAGAQGLMQLMPATARWTARRIGLADFRPENINDIETNLRLGTAYLKVLVDDFAGAQPLAAAAYNAGPGRPRRWRDGPVLEPAAWAENIPFNETRDYVKKVLSNAVVYSALIGGGTPSIKLRLGPSIGPRDTGAPAADREIP